MDHRDLFENVLRDYTNYHRDPASSQTSYNPLENIRELEKQKIKLESINLTLEEINRIRKENNQIVNTKLNSVMGRCTEVITRIKEQTLPKINAIKNDCKIIREDFKKNSRPISFFIGTAANLEFMGFIYFSKNPDVFSFYRDEENWSFYYNRKYYSSTIKGYTRGNRNGD